MPQPSTHSKGSMPSYPIKPFSPQINLNPVHFTSLPTRGSNQFHQFISLPESLLWRKRRDPGNTAVSQPIHPMNRGLQEYSGVACLYQSAPFMRTTIQVNARQWKKFISFRLRHVDKNRILRPSDHSLGAIQPTLGKFLVARVRNHVHKAQQ